ncbi:nitroreductase [Scytonema hofmannii PCC 7110]|uniref:Nitroreductase n=1 Tax=Scytonema hofmannii PCC 7110 TaxID=128403 RepID=A0A139XBA7_9CYAN|nr:nitroreductase family protein [Scytonema hofmannii]KYC41902.1 nitroreductase [Scytonema hofmannii PCC 7110]
MSKIVSSEPLSPWNVSEIDFPKRGSPSQQLDFLLHYAVLAPSQYNAQPWLFKIAHETIELYADRTRALPVIDPQDRELTMSCGAALYNLRLAIRHFGYIDVVKTFPNPEDPDLLAHIWLGSRKEQTEEEFLLFATIKQRHTNRLAFQNKPIPETLLSIMQKSVLEEGAWLHLIQEQNLRNALADLITEGDRIQLANLHFRRELAAWIHSSRNATHDGMPAYAQSIGELLDFATPMTAHTNRTFDIGKGQAAKERELAAGSPVFTVLGTKEETTASWLSAGQALQRLLLLGQAVGVSASFLNQPIQVPELRPQLRNLLNTSGYPQILLRFGYGTEVKSTPRRVVSEVLRYE